MNPYSLSRAAHVLRQGGIVVNATEGVWGLCCDPANEHAVRALLHMKRRSWRAGLILVAHSPSVFAPVTRSLPQRTQALLRQNWPGPVTWLVPHCGRLPQWIHGASPNVALRVTAHEQFAGLCAAFGGALASTSANRNGQPSVASDALARGVFGGDIDYVLHGQLGGANGPSIIVDAQSLQVVRGSPANVLGLAAAWEQGAWEECVQEEAAQREAALENAKASEGAS